MKLKWHKSLGQCQQVMSCRLTDQQSARDKIMNNSILIVEDAPEQLDELTGWFIQAGYRVVAVHHPRQALEAASFRPFQVALLDARLPEIDGLDLMQRLKRMQHDMQVIILGGGNYFMQRARSNGALYCVSKPCPLPLLESLVANAFQRAVNELQPSGHVAARVMAESSGPAVARTADRSMSKCK
jgi:two-component system response regulator (stage 0 sporulation protein F)